jgi:hypothetical protein
MGTADLFVAKDPADLENLLPSFPQEFLHGILGGSVEIHPLRSSLRAMNGYLQGLEVRFHAWGGNEAGGLNFHEPFLQEKPADPLKNPASQDQILPFLLIHDHAPPRFIIGL